MTRNIRVRGIRRKQIDEDKLALAFLLLAKVLHEQEVTDADADRTSNDPQAGGADDAPESA
jgi:hypothetical protein